MCPPARTCVGVRAKVSGEGQYTGRLGQAHRAQQGFLHGGRRMGAMSSSRAEGLHGGPPKHSMAARLEDS